MVGAAPIRVVHLQGGVLVKPAAQVVPLPRVVHGKVKDQRGIGVQSAHLAGGLNDLDLCPRAHWRLQQRLVLFNDSKGAAGHGLGCSSRQRPRAVAAVDEGLRGGPGPGQGGCTGVQRKGEQHEELVHAARPHVTAS